MTGSPELLEFYLVEATEYLDSLDQLVSSTSGPPDGNAFIATARALRGSSSMAKVDEIEQIAGLVERIALAVRDGELRWTVELYGVLRLTVDDLRFLVRNVRLWGERETARAEARAAERARCLPNEERRSPAPDAAATAPVFVALQSSAIAAELDAFVQNPRHKRALDDALNRARTMRGIAGIADFPPLADVADTIDRTARSLMPDAPLADTDIELFRSAAEVLRLTSARLRDGLPPDPEAPEVARFAHAVASQQPPASPATEDRRVVSIDDLFYSDAGPHVLQRSAAPATSRAQRFRDEITARAEHLRRLVNDGRQVHDLAGRDRAERELRSALLLMESSAASFDAHQVAAFFGESARERDLLSANSLEALEAGALLLLAPGDSMDEIERRLAVLERSRRATPLESPVVRPEGESAFSNAYGSRPATPAVPLRPITPIAPIAPVPEPPPVRATTPPASPPSSEAPPQPSAPAPVPSDERPGAVPSPDAPPSSAAPFVSDPAATPIDVQRVPDGPLSHPATRRPPPTPTGRELQELLREGIAGFDSLEDEPLSEPARLEEDEIVPIESLLYRGQSAIRRAIEVRDAMRQRGVSDDANLQELFDLLDLAQAE